MNINYYIIYFLILAFVGYIYETAAMTLWSMKFENRGFMIGPIIPIYGLGAVVGTMVFTYAIPWVKTWQLFLFGVVASALIEYPTHYILEKIFHRTWWDYSKAPLNLHGRICLPAALGFGVAAVLIVKVINPFLIPLILRINPTFANVLAIVIVMVFSADMTLTIAFISDFEEKVQSSTLKIDEKIGESINPRLNEDKPLSKYFYSAVDKIRRR